MKELIKYETAELAKEKGYPQNTPYDHYIVGEDKKFMTDNHYVNFRGGKEENDLLGCPTQAELHKWLREEHFIDVFVIDSIKENCYDWEIRLEDDEPKIECEQYFYNYEAALESGLLKALKLININKTDESVKSN